jgi:hypothetical protein
MSEMRSTRSALKEKINVFLLVGQSNMAGRGHLHEVPALSDPDVLMFREGRWIEAKEPLHTDRPAIAGVGLGMSFAMELLTRRAGKPIGLVPCAVGGSQLRQWMPGADFYVNAVSLARGALADGTLKGILWHQGESNSENADDANSYGQRLRQMISRLRVELMAEHVPVITGELGPFLANYPPCSSFFNIINQQLRGLVEQVPDYACVSAAGLTDNGDALHFNSASLREFGRRYADAYVAIAGGKRVAWRVAGR